MHINIYMNICLFMFMCMCIYMYAYMYVYILCLCICVFICICICVCVCICVYIHTRTTRALRARLGSSRLRTADCPRGGGTARTERATPGLESARLARLVHVEVGSSSLEDRSRGFPAFGGPPRRRGWTRLEKLVRLDPGGGSRDPLSVRWDLVERLSGASGRQF